jgi:hypothetical protein
MCCAPPQQQVSLLEVFDRSFSLPGLWRVCVVQYRTDALRFAAATGERYTCLLRRCTAAPVMMSLLHCALPETAVAGFR